jgi:hypothetical protein
MATELEDSINKKQNETKITKQQTTKNTIEQSSRN